MWITAALKRVSPAAMVHWSVGFWAYGVLLVAFSVLVHRHWETPLRAVLLRRWQRWSKAVPADRVASP